MARIQSNGELQCLVAGAWGDCSADLDSLVQKCAESQVATLCRSTGRPEMEGQLSAIVLPGQETTKLMHCESAGPVPDFKSGCNISTGQGGG